MSTKTTTAPSDSISLFSGQQLRTLAAEESASYLVVNVDRLKGSIPAEQGHDEAARKKLEKLINNPRLDPSLALAFFEIARNLLLPSRTRARAPESDSIFNGFSQYRAANEQRKLDLRASILAEGQWLSSRELSDKAHFTNANRSAGPNAWKRRGRTFAISVEGQDRYPDYAFDEAWQPLPVIKQILVIFDGTRSPWSLAAWFTSHNGWLGGRRPKDLLISDPQAVIAAAQQASVGALHG